MLSRRDFMKAGLATGMLFVFPPLLKGCGSSGSPSAKPLIDWFHFDLSGIVGSHPGTGGAYFLSAGGRKHRLEAHSEETLAEMPLLLKGDLGSQSPTHFAKGVDLSTDSVSLMMLTHQGDDDVHNLLHMSLYVPDTTSMPAARPAIEAASDLTCKPTSTTSDSFQPVIDGGHVYSGASPVQTAACLVFFHPELMTLDPMATSRIAAHIWGLDPFYNLYCHIAQSRYASTHGGTGEPWATLVAAIRDDGTPILGHDGTPVHHLAYSEKTKQYLADVLKPALQVVKNNPALTDKNYRTGAGVPEVNQTAPPLQAGLRAASADFKLVPPLGEGTWKHGIKWHGLGMEDAVQRQFKFTLTNLHVRNFSIYIQYLDKDGQVIDLEKLDNWADYLPLGMGRNSYVANSLQGLDLATSSLKFVDLYLAPSTVMGVPLPIINKTYRPKMPAAAVTARIRVGSLGIPHHLDEVTTGDARRSWMVGAILTAIINCAVPALMLKFGSGSNENKELYALVASDPRVWIDTVMLALADIQGIRDLINGSGDDEKQKSIQDIENGVKNVLMDLATDGAKILLRSPVLAAYVASKEVEMTAEETIPIAGMVLQALVIVATSAELAQTTIESLANPLLYDVDFTVARDITVTVNHDRRDFKFPSTATYFTVGTVITRGTRLSTKVLMPATTQSEPMTAVIRDVPTGGSFLITVDFYDRHDNLVGTGFAAFYLVTDARMADLDKPSVEGISITVPDWLKTRLSALQGQLYTTTQSFLADLYAGLSDLQKDTAESYEFWIMQKMQDYYLPNSIQPGHDGIHYECTIEEKEYPLDAGSTYLHKEKIAFTAGARAWRPAPAPTATLTALSSVAGDAALHELTGMALVQRSGQFGYAWRSSSTGLPQCGSGTTRAELFTVQNISLGQNPENSLRTGIYGEQACGLTPPVNISYDLNGPSSGRGHNFILVPKNGFFYLRPYVADGQTPMVLDPAVTLGRFEHPLAAMAYHPAGYLVGVSREFSKLAILALPEGPQVEENAPRPVLYGGRGALPGLLDRPCGLGVDDRGTIHVLESGNRRLQAFDIHGQPVNAYAGGASCFFALPSDITFIDLAVNGRGWLYLLGYENFGAAPHDFILFVHKPGEGTPLFTVRGVAAGKIMVDKWRDLYALNYEKIVLPSGRVEPSVSHWIPDTPNPTNP